jgi:hypothetical protein
MEVVEHELRSAQPQGHWRHFLNVLEQGGIAPVGGSQGARSFEQSYLGS